MSWHKMTDMICILMLAISAYRWGDGEENESFWTILFVVVLEWSILVRP